LPAGPSKKLQSAKVKVEPGGGTCPLQLRGSTSKIILSLFFLIFFTTVQELMIVCSENIKGKQEREEYYGSIISSVDH